LVAKTASSAVRCSGEKPIRVLRAVLHGDATTSLQARGEPWEIHRSAPSLRFGIITEVSLEFEGAVSDFRKFCFSIGHAVIGDAKYGGRNVPHVRYGRVYLAVEGVSFRGVSAEQGDASCVQIRIPSSSIGRFDRLFEKEAKVWQHVQDDDENIASAYVQQCKEFWLANYAKPT